jgi:Arc/MetJ-type ribon-helix-helix transcriptional regulator
MTRFRSRQTLTIAVAALAVIGGGGAAIAAAQGSSSSSGQSFLDSVARHLGISSQKLEDATKAAAVDEVDAALKEGKITKTQADELKARIESGVFRPFAGPLFGPRSGHFHLGGPPLFGEKLSAAADYLGLTEAELRTKLNAGQTLAEIAKARGKSVDGLKQAILDEAEKKLGQLVEDGELTQAEADEMLARLKSHIDDLVDHGMFRFRERLGGEPRERPFW